jgi:Xaa-Pro aminopeptidase
VLTDVIEAERLRHDEVPPEFEIWKGPWQEPDRREAFVTEITSGGRVASDRPRGQEISITPSLVKAKRRLLPEEIRRYRSLGAESAKAVTEALSEVTPEWTELEVAAQTASALRKRGIDPALVQVGGDERVELYRHILPTAKKVGKRVMVAICARRHGLYASLTRFVSFQKLGQVYQQSFDTLAQIEAVALRESRPGSILDWIYLKLASAYGDAGFADQIDRHHQGGTTGYLAREVIALPNSQESLEDATAIAWNPSLPGAKIEDTFIMTAQGLENLTFDPAWPSFEYEGRKRPAVWVRS